MDKLNILLISKDKQTIEYLNSTLRLKYSIINLDSYDSILDYYKSGRGVSLIIADIDNNVSDFIDFMNKTNDNKDINITPIMCLVNNKEEQILCFNNNATEALMKPIDNSVTEIKVKRVIDYYSSNLNRRESALLKENCENETRFYNLVNNLDLAYTFIELDLDKLKAKVLYSNDKYYEVFKVDKAKKRKVRTIDFNRGLDSNDIDRFITQIKAIVSCGKANFSDNFIFNSNINGEKLNCKVKIIFNGEYSNSNPLLYCLFDDVTEYENVKEKNKKYQEELDLKYTYDDLTNIYNKQVFEEKTDLLFSFNPNISYYIICFNIDKFSMINDTLGSEVGDMVLVGFSRAMSKYLNHVGSYGRLRDDDFVLSIPKSLFNEEEFNNFLEHSLDDLKINYHVIIYAGIYEVNDRSLTISQMIDRALLALESNDINYLHRYSYYDDKMYTNLLDEQEIEKEMVDALNNHEFVIYLQPIYSLSINNVCKAETLVRWRHPVKGMISPGKFIPVFENNGFIIRLDRYVWEEACKYQRSRIDRKRRIFPLSINISRKDLYYEDTIDYITDLVKKYDLKTDLIELEITESAYTDNPNLIIESVNEFKKRGFKVLMDDFGSGYSSFNTLKDLNVDTIKLDMKFLEDFETSTKTSAIITSIVRMAKWLNMDLIAEGVETTEEMNFLRNLGCDKLQGYLLSKPISIKEFEDQNKKDLDALDTAFRFNENDYVELFETFSDNKRFDISLGGIGVFEFKQNKKLIIRKLNELGVKVFKFPHNLINYRDVDLLDYISKDDKKNFISICEKALFTHDAIRQTLKFKDYENNDIYIDLYIRGLGKEHISEYLCINFMDITDFKQNQLSLQHNYNSFVDNASIGLFKMKVEDGNYTLFDANTVISKMLGYKSPNELEKYFERHPFYHIQAKDLEQVKKYIELCIKTDKAYNYNLTFLNYNGKIRRCNTVCFKVSDKTSTSVQFMINQISSDEIDDDFKELYPVLPSICEEIFEINTRLDTFKTKLNGYLEGVSHVSDKYTENMKAVCHQLIHPDDRKTFYNSIMRMFDKSDKFERIEFIYRALVNGKYKYFLDTIVRLNDEITYLFIKDFNDAIENYNDKFEQENREKELDLVNNEHFILERANRIIIEYNYLTDSLYKSEDLNKYNISDLNYNQMKLFKYYKDYIHEDDIEILNKFSNDLNINNYASMTIRLASSLNGITNYIYNNIYSVRIKDKNGQNVKIRTIIQDVNDQRIDYMETYKQKELFESYYDSCERIANDLPISIGITEIVEGKVYPKYMTKSLCDLLGFDYNDIRYKIDNNETIVDVILNNLNLDLPEYVNEEKDFDLQVSFVNFKGDRIWTHLIGKVKAIDNGYKYYYCALDDNKTYNLTDNEKVDRIFEVENDIALNVLFTYNVKEDTNIYYLMNSNHKLSRHSEFAHFINYISASNFIHEDFKNEYLDIFKARKIENKKFSGIYEYLAMSNGVYHWFRIIYHYVYDEEYNITDIYGEILDVNKQQVRRDELIEMIETDHLSGLTNRIVAEGKIRNLLKNNIDDKKYAFVLLDIDYFKQLNDTYGHPTGDKIIQQVSTNLITVFGKANAILSRFGGDEFVCFIEYNNMSEVTSGLENLMYQISKININLELKDTITLSVGISLNDKDNSFVRMYNDSDKALYSAKNKRNTYVIMGKDDE